MSDRSFRRILHEDLHFHPYKLQIVQEIRPRDWVARETFCLTMRDLLRQNPQMLHTILMSDEAHFELWGSVNKQNMRYWSDGNPHELHIKPLHSSRVTVWCGVASFGIIGPYFFEDDRGVAVTVTSERYLKMLQDFVLPQLGMVDVDVEQLWFQQDGATSHTARICMDFLRQTFSGRVISRFGDISWPPRSPNLSCADFFLWGHLKQEVFRTRCATIPELKDRIRTAVGNVPGNMLRRVMASFQRRLDECVVQRGHHLTGVIFKK